MCSLQLSPNARTTRAILAGIFGLLWLFSAGPSIADHVVTSELQNANQVTFFAFGDQGTGERDQQNIAHALEKVVSEQNTSSFVVLLGDNFYDDGVKSTADSQWKEKFESVYDGPALRDLPFFAVLGNHDRRGSYPAEVAYSKQHLGSGRWQMPEQHYVRDFGQIGGRPLVRIAFLDTTPGNDLESKQIKMLQSAFTGGDGDPIWKVVAGHHPLRNRGKRHGPTKELIEWLLPTLQETGVDLYLSGHEHNQQVIEVPGEPLYVISGGGGRKLHKKIKKGKKDLKFGAATHGFAKVSAAASILNIEFFDDKGKMIHETELKARD